jgi:membrane protease YdiL (CAAX protease family)
MAARHLILITAVLALSTQGARAAPPPGVSGTLSIVPGLGQVANGDALEGAGWFAASIGLFLSRNPYVSNVGFKLWMYNMYDAYKDAGAKETTKHSALANYAGVANPLNIVDPFSAGFLTYSTLAAFHTPPDQKSKLGPDSEVLGAFYFGATGLGEEGLFRGFLYPGFSYLFSSHLAGATLSSLLFAAAHLANTQGFYHSYGGLAYLFSLGMLWCWQTTYNHYDLRHNIFTHAWFDWTLEYVGGKAQNTGNGIPPIAFRINLPLGI